MWAELVSSADDSSSNETVKPQPAEDSGISKTVASFPVASSSPLDAVWDSSEAKAFKDSPGKATILENHWSQVFNEKGVSHDSIDELLAGYRAAFPSHEWALDRGHLKHILKHPKKSCPGPDGIPFHAFSVVPEISEIVLWDCANNLLELGEPPLNFNWATFVFLPKKPSVEENGVRCLLQKIRGPCTSLTLITESLQFVSGGFGRVRFQSMLPGTKRISQQSFFARECYRYRCRSAKK